MHASDSSEMRPQFFVGVDCGTASVRAAVFDSEGTLIASHAEPISVFNPRPDHFQQSSTEIWTKTCVCVKTAIEIAGIDTSDVKGLGFDATCSLVCLGEGDRPISVDWGDPAGSGLGLDQNIILWMDHRASKEADEITVDRYRVLETVGMEMSPEMESPKMLWLKRNMPDRFAEIASFWDLGDFLVHCATGTTSRSKCPLVCKWTFDERGWDEEYWRAIGLPELAEENYKRIGRVVDVLPVGAPVPGGISPQAAAELGLLPGTAVASAMIDAHAAYTGTIGCRTLLTSTDHKELVDSRLVIIAGTSTCHLVNTTSRTIVPGVWGPQHGSTLDGYYTLEGGQSATGNVLEHLV